MPAPKNNKNALKEATGLQINFYLSGVDVAYIKRRLTRELEREPTTQEMRHFARKQAKNGIYTAIKSEMPAVIL
jgi:hypothetical protein